MFIALILIKTIWRLPPTCSICSREPNLSSEQMINVVKLSTLKTFITVPIGLLIAGGLETKKIALGIEDNIETVSLEDYIGMVSDTASTLMEFDEPLRELVKKKSAIVSSIEVSLNDKTLFDLSIGKKTFAKGLY